MYLSSYCRQISSPFHLVVLALTLGFPMAGGCDQATKLVGAECTKDSECTQGTCAKPEDGFSGGYCTGPCEGNEDPPKSISHSYASCVFAMGQKRWVASCGYQRDMSGYACAGGTYDDDYLLPVCSASDDCRGCACPDFQTCSPSSGWTCRTTPQAGDSCVLGRNDCRGTLSSTGLVCATDSAGENRCATESSIVECALTEGCPPQNTCTVETPTETVCDYVAEGYEIVDVCYEVAVAPILIGDCSTRLGAECEVNEDCDIGFCLSDGGQGEKHCTSTCGSSEYCIETFGEPRALCCNTDLNDVCMYDTGGGYYCQWW